MKNHLTLCLLVCAFFLNAQSNLDTLSGVDWYPVDLPDVTVPVTNFDELRGYGNTLYATVEDQFYRSDDGGQTWINFGMTPDYLASWTGNATGILSTLSSENPSPGPSASPVRRDYYLHSESNDAWKYRGTTGNYFSGCAGCSHEHLPYPLNDSLFLQRSQYNWNGLTGTTYLKVYDGLSESVDTLIAALGTAQVLVYRPDTLLTVRGTGINANDTLILQKVTTNGSNLPRDTFVFSSTIVSMQLDARNGTLLFMRGDTLNSSDDYGGSWSQRLLPDNHQNLKFGLDGAYYKYDDGIGTRYYFVPFSDSVIPEVPVTDYGQSVGITQVGDAVYFKFWNGGWWKHQSSDNTLLPLNPIPHRPTGELRRHFNYTYWVADTFVYRRPIDGTAWTFIANPSIRNGLLGKVRVDTTGYLFINDGSNVYQSQDGGTTWQFHSIQTEHPDFDIRGGVWLAPSQFYSFDAGATWTPFAISPGTLYGYTVRGDTLFGVRRVHVFPNIFTQMVYGPLNTTTWEYSSGVEQTQGSIPPGIDLPIINESGLYSYHARDGVQRLTDPTGSWQSTPGEFPEYRFWASGPSYGDGYRSTLRFFQDSVAVVHARDGVYLSDDYGQSFTVLPDVPIQRSQYFKQSDGTGSITYWPGIRFFEAGADAYSLIGTRLYAQMGNRFYQTDLTDILGTQPPAPPAVGTLFVDYNDDCTPGGITDQLLAHRAVRIGDVWKGTDAQGQFRTRLPAGNYPVETAAPPYTTEGCVDWQEVAVQPGTAFELPFQTTAEVTDAQLSVVSYGALRNISPFVLTTTVRNRGTEPLVDVPVKLWRVAGPNFVPGAGSEPYTATADTIQFTVSLAPNAHQQLTLELLPPFGDLGTPYQFAGRVEASNDALPGDNQFALHATVVGSYDPNDKRAFPHGHVFPETANTLDYVIRFQNTGTDTAFTVLIADTFDLRYDLATLETLDASHNFSFELRSERVANWLFHPIALVDSLTNAEGSQGYVHFRIRTHGDVPHGDTLRNRAAIYFDLNPPILTEYSEEAVERAQFVRTDSVTLCAGGLYQNWSPAADTLVLETVQIAQWDSLFYTHIFILPAPLTFADTTLTVGSEFLGVEITHPINLTQTLTTTAGCDSTVIWQIDVLTASGNPQSPSWSARLQPNPSPGATTLYLTSDEPRDLTMTLMDLQGRMIRSEQKLSVLPGIRSAISLPATGLPMGTYLVRIRGQNEVTTLRWSVLGHP